MRAPSVDWRPSEKYRFLLRSDFTLTLPEDWHGHWLFYENGKCLATMLDSSMTIYAGFSWDGCSPSQLFGIKWLSAPSPASTIVGSLYHDLFYQFVGVRGCPWDRRCADDELRSLLRGNSFPAADLYYYAVRLFGGNFVQAKQGAARDPRILSCI